MHAQVFLTKVFYLNQKENSKKRIVKSCTKLLFSDKILSGRATVIETNQTFTLSGVFHKTLLLNVPSLKKIMVT